MHLRQTEKDRENEKEGEGEEEERDLNNYRFARSTQNGAARRELRPHLFLIIN